MKYNIVFYDSFKPSQARLTRVEQAAVFDTLLELSERPESPGLKVHRVGDASTQCWSARVNDDIQLIFFRVSQTVVPAYVAHHDPAYKWAEGRALDVHPDTGAAQIVIVGERWEEILKRVVVEEKYDAFAAKPFGDLTQPDESAKRAFIEMEHTLLYVASSRARERLLFTGAGRPSEFLSK